MHIYIFWIEFCKVSPKGRERESYCILLKEGACNFQCIYSNQKNIDNITAFRMILEMHGVQ